MSFAFKTTADPQKIREIYAISGTEWGANLSPQEFGEAEFTRHQFLLENGDAIQVFYLEDEKGNPVASTSVKEVKGFYKDADRSHAISSVPDPSLFGVKNIRILVIGHVFTLKEYRKKGLAQQLVKQAIEFTENAIIQKKITESDESKNDSFKNMVVSDGVVDKQLANYYLSKQYFWVLYSGIGTWYERFGFQAFPLEFYKVPSSILSESQETLVKQLLDHDSSAGPETVGKKLKLLHSSSKADQDLISFILQGKELEILTELNKVISHTELQGDRRSSSSLSNVHELLSMTKVSSGTGLSSINESSGPDRRKSSIVNSTTPKISFKPSYTTFRGHQFISNASAEKSVDKEEAVKWNDINGAIFTNDLQGKSYYIIWHTLMLHRLVILGMGELKFEAFSGLGDPTGMGPRKRRGSSFTGLNELGGHNFQDLDVLLSVATYVAKKGHFNHKSVIVSTNDTPSHVPTPILHDYFLNYLPNNFENVIEPGAKDVSSDQKVELITDAAKELLILPMLKKFGSNSPEFALDWNASSMSSWS